MTKNVIIAIKGLQYMDNDNDSVEFITNGLYYRKNGKHYVLYDEIVEGYNEPAKNTIIFNDDKFEMIKKGIINTHMTFEEKKKNSTYYELPFGSIMIETNTNQVDVTETEKEINVMIKYGLDVNYAFVSDCEITVKIKSENIEELGLMK